MDLLRNRAVVHFYSKQLQPIRETVPLQITGVNNFTQSGYGIMLDNQSDEKPGIELTVWIINQISNCWLTIWVINYLMKLAQ